MKSLNVVASSLRSPALVVALTLGALGISGGCGPNPGEPEPDPLPEVRETPPSVPAENSVDFTIEGVPQWTVIGNELTAGVDVVDILVRAPEGVMAVDIFVDGGPGRRLARDGTIFEGGADLSEIGPGEVEILLSEGGADEAFARVLVMRTHPLYVLVGTDWDDADNDALTYDRQEELHAFYPGLRITHFVGPYTWTDPAVSEERVAFNEMWLHSMVNDYDDEVGVHIHPYCNFVDTTTVTCRTMPSVVYDAGDASGYTVESAAYTEAEYTELLLATDALFVAAGFDKPVSFRAGAWTADMSTLRAVQNAGYTVDSNAYNWARMEEWIGLGNGAFYDWVSENWSLTDDLSQPYYPSANDLQLPGPDALDVLEVPLNGVMADYVTGTEMIEIFDANWAGDALLAPTTFAIGYHPGSYDDAFHGRMTEALDHISMFEAGDDTGPVVYATFAEMTEVFANSE